MSKPTTITFISVLVVAVIGGLVLSSNQTSVPADNATTTPATSTDSDGITRTINALHQYQPNQNRHIVAGTTTVPTPCHRLSADVTTRESYPEQVVIDFTASKADEDSVCAQQIQEVRFKVTFSASKDAKITGGTFNGDRVELNLREVKAGQDLNNFQIYTKG